MISRRERATLIFVVASRWTFPRATSASPPFSGSIWFWYIFVVWWFDFYFWPPALPLLDQSSPREQEFLETNGRRLEIISGPAFVSRWQWLKVDESLLRFRFKSMACQCFKRNRFRFFWVVNDENIRRLKKMCFKCVYFSNNMAGTYKK